MTNNQTILFNSLVSKIGNVELITTTKVDSITDEVVNVRVFFKNDINTQLKTVTHKIRKFIKLYRGFIYLMKLKTPKKMFVYGFNNGFSNGYKQNYISLSIKVKDKPFFTTEGEICPS